MEDALVLTEVPQAEEIYMIGGTGNQPRDVVMQHRIEPLCVAAEIGIVEFAKV